jgi:L-ascorbate metabolism protein UlaG (beta-lactamase superfamily)
MTTKITWYGHATIGLEINNLHVLVDPYFTGNSSASTTAAAVKADFILVTHGHGDHVGDTLEIAKRTGALVISNAEISRWLRDKGLKNVHGQHIGGGHQHPFGYLKLTIALHGSGLPDGSYGGLAAGLLLTTPDGRKIYLAGDTGLFGDMALIGEEGVDLAMLPIGDNYTMGPADALRAVKLLRPGHVIPIHYNTFGLIQQDPLAWKVIVEKETPAAVHVLQPGETFVIS